MSNQAIISNENLEDKIIQIKLLNLTICKTWEIMVWENIPINKKFVIKNENEKSITISFFLKVKYIIIITIKSWRAKMGKR